MLVVLIDDIYDLISAGPALRTLQRALPDAKITLLTSPGGSRVAPLLPWVDAILVCPADWSEALVPLSSDEPALVEALRARRFEAAVILAGPGQSPYPAGYVCYLAGVPVRLGQSVEFGGGVLSQTVKPIPETLSLVDHYLYLLEAAGFQPAGRYLELHIPDSIRQTAAALLGQVDPQPETPFAVLAFGIEQRSRRTDPARYTSTVRLLLAETGLPLLLVGSRWDSQSIKPVLDLAREYPLISLCGRTSVAEFAAIISQASLVIANDADAIALTHALQRPLVTLAKIPMAAPAHAEEEIGPEWLLPEAGLGKTAFPFISFKKKENS